MRVYIVIRKPDLPADMPFFLDYDDCPPRAFGDKESAEEYARYAASLHRGEIFWIIEGDPVAAFRAQPVKVDAVSVDV